MGPYEKQYLIKCPCINKANAPNFTVVTLVSLQSSLSNPHPLGISAAKSMMNLRGRGTRLGLQNSSQFIRNSSTIKKWPKPLKTKAFGIGNENNMNIYRGIYGFGGIL